MGSLVAELAEKLSAATNSLDFDEQTMFLNTSANTVGIGTNAPASKLDVRGTMQVGVNDVGHDVKFFGATSGSYWLWDEDANGVVQIGTLTVGVDDAGHDVKFFGATATNGYMLWDESTDDLILGSSSKVGIGTTAPDTYLHIQKADASAAPDGETLLVVENTGNAGIEILGSTSATQWLAFSDTTSMRGMIQYTNTGDNMNFYTAGSTRMRITSDGKVGIGETSPDEALHITGSGDWSGSNVKLENTHAGSGGPLLQFFKVSASPADSDYLGGIDFYGNNDADESTRWGYMYGQCIDASNGSEDGAIMFTTARAGTVDTVTMSLVSGNVGIGTSAPTSPSLGTGSTNTFLEITNSNAAGITLHATDGSEGAWDIFNGGGNLEIRDNDAYRIFIQDTTGYVGINTTSPTSKLHVVGGATFTNGWTMPVGSAHSINLAGNSQNWQIFNNGSESYAGTNGISFYSSGTKFAFATNGDAAKATGAGDWSNWSDKRLKTEISELSTEYCLSVIESVTPKRFKWINPEQHPTPTNDAGFSHGFIAQDLEQIDELQGYVKTGIEVSYPLVDPLEEDNLDLALLEDGTEDEGKPKTSSLGMYHAFVSGAIQELNKRIKVLENA